MTLLRKLAVLSAFVFAAGCNPTGTCMEIADKESNVNPSRCEVNIRKDECDNVKGTFTKENEIAGMLHCKLDGFWEDKKDPGKPGERVSYHRYGNPDAAASSTGAGKSDSAAPSAPSKYVSAAGNYEAQFEHTPETSVVNDPQGVPWQQAEDKAAGAWVVQYADFATPERSAKEMADFALTTNPKDQTVEKTSTFQGYPSRELEMPLPSGKATLRVRFVQVGTRLYKIAGAFKSDRTKLDAFFESVKITAAPAAASGAAKAPAAPIAPTPNGAPKGAPNAPSRPAPPKPPQTEAGYY